MENYVPQPGVIQQNEMFDFALKSAPNVLYARFKQFGQVRRARPLHALDSRTDVSASTALRRYCSWACSPGVPSSAR